MITITINERTNNPTELTINLKKCPFCGSDAKIFDSGYGPFGVSCVNCFASISSEALIHDKERIIPLINKYGIKPYITPNDEYSDKVPSKVHGIYTKDINRLYAIEKWNRRV